MNTALRLHLAPPPPDTDERPSAEDIARAKEIHDRDVAQAEVEMREAEEHQRGEAILLIVEAYERLGRVRTEAFITAIERYTPSRARRWLWNVVTGMRQGL